MSDTVKAGSCRPHLTVQHQTNLAKHRMQRKVDLTRCVRVNVCFLALVILASTCRRELFRSKYKSFAHLTVNTMAIPGWIVASGAYSRLNPFSITFCRIIDQNKSTSLVI